MKNGKKPGQFQRNYALRRVIYDMMVAAKSILILREEKRDFSMRETAKLAGVIMARNLDEFLFGTNEQYDDDIHLKDFDLTAWSPDSNAALNKTKRRISKLAGHVVASRPSPFTSVKELEGFVIPLIAQVGQFVAHCVADGRARLSGEAKRYLRRLNGMLAELGLGIVRA